MAAGIVYLVHFPDGTEAIHNLILAGVPQPGDEILPNWILGKPVKMNEQVMHGVAVQFEAWVVSPPEPDDFTAG
jgi:hypothetical protein